MFFFFFMPAFEAILSTLTPTSNPPPIFLEVSMVTVITFHTFISTWHISYAKWPGVLVWGIQLSIFSNCVWDRQRQTERRDIQLDVAQLWHLAGARSIHFHLASDSQQNYPSSSYTCTENNVYVIKKYIYLLGPYYGFLKMIPFM